MWSVAISPLVLGLCSAQWPSPLSDSAWQSLHRPSQHVWTFDHTVLGNLANASEIRDIRVPRSHSFLTEFNVGTPPQPMRCLLDTGFADLWVPSKQCRDCDAETFFRSEKSTTFRPIPSESWAGPGSWESVRIPLDGKEEVKGYLGQDTVGFGSGLFHNQTFFMVDEAVLPKDRDWDGICGLGWLQLTDVPRKRLSERIAAVSQGGRNVFAFVPGQPHRSYLVVGQVPHAACKEGTLSWAKAEPIQKGGERLFWVVSGGLAIHKRKPVESRFLLDTGTSFLLAPPSKYAGFMRSLFPLAGFDRLCGLDAAAGNLIVCDCSIMELPGLLPVRLYLGGRPFVLEVPDLFKRVKTTKGGELCLLQIQQNPMKSADPLNLLSDLLGGDISRRDQMSRPDARIDAVKYASSHPAMPEALTDVPQDSGLAELGEDRVEEVVSTTPDGSECRTIMVWRAGALRSNTTKCGAPSGATVVRKLQTIVPMPGSFVPVGSEVLTEMRDNIWVLGGVFLEHFVTILDFESNAVGFAEPTSKVIVPNKSGGLSALPDQGTADSAIPSALPSSWTRNENPTGHDSDHQVDAPQDQDAFVHSHLSHPGVTTGADAAGEWALILKVVALLGAAILPGAAGLTWLARKLKRRKNLAEELVAEAEEDPLSVGRE